jgi:hypothetical protein
MEGIGGGGSFSDRLDIEHKLTPPGCDTGQQDWLDVAYDFVHDEYLVVWENEWPGGCPRWAKT